MVSFRVRVTGRARVTVSIRAKVRFRDGARLWLGLGIRLVLRLWLG